MSIKVRHCLVFYLLVLSFALYTSVLVLVLAEVVKGALVSSHCTSQLLVRQLLHKIQYLPIISHK